MLAICKDSHLDHGLTMAQLRWVLSQFGDRDGFFIETVELPEGLGRLSCSLYGPMMGDNPLSDDVVCYRTREGREGVSRLVDLPARPTRTITVIAGPHGGLNCVLYTVYGGPSSPKEPSDPTLKDEEREASEAFWSEHALASQG